MTLHPRSLLVALALSMLPGLAEAQTLTRPEIHQGGPTVEGQEVEGTIKRIDLQAGTITLDNGEEYVVPASVLTDRRALTEGTVVRFRYDVTGGRNLVRSVQARL
jgi:hypothetical protein